LFLIPWAGGRIVFSRRKYFRDKTCFSLLKKRFIALKSLQTMDFVVEKKSGKNIYYKVNTANSSVKNFKIFITTTELNPFINDLKNISEKIILFGSCSTGDDTAASDIDLFILSHDPEKVKTYLNKKRSGRTIQVVIVNAAELVKLKEHDEAFYQEIAKGITLREGQK